MAVYPAFDIPVKNEPGLTFRTEARSMPTGLHFESTDSLTTKVAALRLDLLGMLFHELNPVAQI